MSKWGPYAAALLLLGALIAFFAYYAIYNSRQESGAKREFNREEQLRRNQEQVDKASYGIPP
ncbi:MAG: hypothetical protein RLZZ127_1154 [Planctomycetota bacterium]|jgi:hypothetical protein